MTNNRIRKSTTLFIIVVVALCSCWVAHAQDPPKFMNEIFQSGQIIYYDTTPSRNSDFQSSYWTSYFFGEKGLVLPYLGPDGKPEYALAGASPLGSVSSPASFSSYFNQVNGISEEIVVGDILEFDQYPPFIYELHRFNYFPLNGLGFDNAANYPSETIYYDDNGNPQNFHFCAHLQYKFDNYPCEIEYSFTNFERGNMWIYMDGMLVFDNPMGQPQNTFFRDNVKLDIFYCSMSTPKTDLTITISMCRCYQGQCCRVDDCLQPFYENLCGFKNCDSNIATCFGTFDGLCNNVAGNYCTTPVCDNNFPYTCMDTETCPQDGITCNTESCTDESTGTCASVDICPPSTDTCFVGMCDVNANACVLNPIVCDDGNPCTLDWCGDGSCGYSDLCNTTSLCERAHCRVAANGIDGECYIEDLCVDIDQCIIGSCISPLLGCQFVAVQCDDGDDSTIDACINGQCEVITDCTSTDVYSSPTV